LNFIDVSKTARPLVFLDTPLTVDEADDSDLSVARDRGSNGQPSPYGTKPVHSGMQQVAFHNANEKSIGRSVAYEFGAFGLSGLSAGTWYSHGWEAN